MSSSKRLYVTGRYSYINTVFCDFMDCNCRQDNNNNLKKKKFTKNNNKKVKGKENK